MWLVAFAVGVAAADASKGVVKTFGAAGVGAGEFTLPGGVAVNETSGDVYVADVGAGDGSGQRIEQFSAEGEFVRAWGWGVATGASAFEVCTASCAGGLRGPGDGQFAFQVQDPATFAFTHPQLAVDQEDGSVYVADTLNDRVQRFTATGAYLGQFGVPGGGDGQLSSPQGVAVDPVSGDVYVADTGNNRVQRFSSAGVYLSQIGTVSGGVGDGEFFRPKRLAVDSGGRLLVVDAGNLRIQRFSAAGAFDGVFASGAVNYCSLGDPDLAVDRGTDHVFIVGCNADFSVTGIIEVDEDGQAVDAHPSPFEIVGLAVRPATGQLYASDRDVSRVAIFDDVTPPTVSIDPVTDISAVGATLHGSVNPQGAPNTSYRFEYSTDGANWTSLPGTDVSIGDGVSDVVVAQTADGLEPGTEYRARLVATKDFNAAGATSVEVTFTTDAAAPLVRPLAAGSRSDTAAWLGGQINPRNSQTSYFVEYALASDAAYASSLRVPLAPDETDAGSGGEFVTVQQLATGLQPDTIYRFRVVATNQTGTTRGPDLTFTTRKSLPVASAGRGYEMVSPLDKNGGDVDRNLPDETLASTSGASPSGNVVAYASQAQFAGIASGSAQGQYRSVRGETGWTTRGISPPLAAKPFAELLEPTVEFLSEDLSRAVISTSAALVGQAGMLGGSWGLYLQDNTGTETLYRLLSVPADPLAPIDPVAVGVRTFSFGGASSDMRHVVFESSGRQLTAGGFPGETWRGVYQWSDGQLRLVSLLPSGAPAALSQAGTGARNGQFYPGDHLVSDNGERVFFTDGAADAGGPLYVREHGAVTTALSVSERAGDDSSVVHNARFQAAKASDGSMALFTSASRLTDDAAGENNTNLYLWDATAPVGERLTNLTTGAGDGGGALGIAGAAADMSRVYFVATGALAEGAEEGQPNLYLWTAGQGVRHVITLGSQDAAVWSTDRRAGSNPQFRDARVSTGGAGLVFVSRERLTADDTGGHSQVYLYDAAADRLSCVSCMNGGLVSDGDAWLFKASTIPYRLSRNLSADGSRAFFETGQALVAGDTNGKTDVYQWSSGELSLISSGRGRDDSEFIDASADGRDVFFTTRERLVGADVDNQVDVYDARVGGGFPDQKLPPACQGDECQGPLAVRPELVPPASTKAGGDTRVTSRPSFSMRKLTVAQRRALADGRRARLSIRVSTPGKVTVRGMARLGGTTKRVIDAVGTARRAGVFRLAVRLSPGARRRLSVGGRLRVSLVVRFGVVREARSQSLTLVSATSKRKGR